MEQLAESVQCLALDVSRFVRAIRDGLNAIEVADHLAKCQHCKKYYDLTEQALAGELPLNEDEKILLLRFLCQERGYFDDIYNFLLRTIERQTKDTERRAIDEIARTRAWIESISQTTSQNTKSIKKLYLAVALLCLAVTVIVVVFFYGQYRTYRNQSAIENTDINNSDQVVKRYEQVCDRLELEPLNQELIKEKESIEYRLLKVKKDAKTAFEDPYDQFDELFNQYLVSEDLKILDRLKTLAAHMNEKGDRFGEASISDFNHLEFKLHANYLSNRTRLVSLIKDKSFKDFDNRLESLNQLNHFFTSNGLNCDALRCQLASARLMIFLNKHDQVLQIVKSVIAQSHNEKLVYIEACGEGQLGNYYGNVSAFDSAIGSFSRQINLLSTIGSIKDIAGAKMVLVGINATLNNNQAAIEDGINLLSSVESDSRFLSSLYGWIAFASASTNNNHTSALFFRKAIDISESTENFYNLSTLKAYLAIVKAKQNKFTEADILLKESFDLVNKITDVNFQNTLNLFLNGYYAKFLMLSGESDRAIAFYKKALEYYSISQERSYLIEADIHEGLGQAYLAQGRRDKAKGESALVNSLKASAVLRKETQNRFVSFVAMDIALSKSIEESN